MVRPDQSAPSSVPGYARSPGPPARRPSASSGLAAKRPQGRWLSPTPYLKSRVAFSTSAWQRRPAGIRPSRTRFGAPEMNEPTGKGHPVGKPHSPAPQVRGRDDFAGGPDAEIAVPTRLLMAGVGMWQTPIRVGVRGQCGDSSTNPPGPDRWAVNSGLTPRREPARDVLWRVGK